MNEVRLSRHRWIALCNKVGADPDWTAEIAVKDPIVVGGVTFLPALYKPMEMNRE